MTLADKYEAPRSYNTDFRRRDIEIAAASHVV